MHKGKYLFSQIVGVIPQYQFQAMVKKHKGEKGVRTFSCWEQMLCLMFGQLSYRESSRGIILCLNAHKNKLYHLGFSGKEIPRKTLLDANEKRDYKIYQDFALFLIPKVRKLYSEKEDSPFDFELEHPAYALDSSTVDLCLHLFPWALFRKRKAAVKLHTMIDLQGNIPVFLHVTDGKIHDVNILDDLEIEAGAFYVIDRGYLDYERLYGLHQKQAFFVTRTKSNSKYKRIYSQKITEEEKQKGVKYDQISWCSGFYTRKKYSDKVRIIKLFDVERNKTYRFITNNFTLSPFQICQMYKKRWEIELFFKWIKQHLRIKKFWGYSANAVKTQIWVAVITYLTIAIIKKEKNIDFSLYEILQILSTSLFDKIPLESLFLDADYTSTPELSDQLTLGLDI
ncbi:MAG: IS4 family transposase [Candidatus Aminicenantaceae bacterium]